MNLRVGERRRFHKVAGPDVHGQVTVPWSARFDLDGVIVGAESTAAGTRRRTGYEYRGPLGKSPSNRTEQLNCSADVHDDVDREP
jgi:mannose/fructose/N-acetylgalactosamine-specific phosphotransferase system component IIB